MAGNGDHFPVTLFWGGEMVFHGDQKSVHYSALPKTSRVLSRSSRFEELVAEVHIAMNTADDNTKLTLFGRYPSMIPGGEVVFVPFPLTSSQTWQCFLDAALPFRPVQMYVVSEKITVDVGVKENQRFAHGEPVLKSCINRVGSSVSYVDLTSDDENEDRLNFGDDRRVCKISKFCQGEPPHWKHNTSKASSSCRKSEVAHSGGNVATSTDAFVTTNPSPTATQAASRARDAVIATKPSPTAIQAGAAFDASQTEDPFFTCMVKRELIPKVNVRVISCLGEYQKMIKEGLAKHPEVLASFRENSPFARFLDVEFIPPGGMMWQLLVRESKMKRKHEMWFVINGVPVRYSLMEFALISGLNCSELNPGFETLYDVNAQKSFIEDNFPLVRKDMNSVRVTYNMVVKRFNKVCELLDDDDDDKNKKKAGVDAVRLATLIFIVGVLLAPCHREKVAIPDWILGLIGEWRSICDFPWGTWAFMKSLESVKKDLVSKALNLCSGCPPYLTYSGFVLPLGILLLESCPDLATRFAIRSQQTSLAQPRICLWKGVQKRKRIACEDVGNAMDDVQIVRSILCPNEFEAKAEWFRMFHPLQTTPNPDLDMHIASLNSHPIHIPVTRKKKAPERKQKAPKRLSTKATTPKAKQE